MFGRKIVVKNGKIEMLYKINYQGYETRNILGIKYKKKVWKTKWVDSDAYWKYKHKPLASRPWEARFFD